MRLPDDAYLQFTDDLRICRLLNGMWQVSGGHGHIDRDAALQNMHEYHADGLTTWDLADHYGPAEDFIGAFGQKHTNFVAFTKWVPRPEPMSRSKVEAAIDVSRRRMQTDTLDLLQFHWWDYADRAYLDALDHMAALRDAGKIRHLALTNFDTQRVRTITEHGVRIVSNHLQYSLIDRRPEVKMIPYCQSQNIWLLTYGTLAGGLLADRYLDKPEPRNLDTASLRKYKQMIDLWGGWALFQELLTALRSVADKHRVSIANVAVRYILQKPAVAGAIAGVRLGRSDNRAENTRVFGFVLDDDDRAVIHTVTDRSRDLFSAIGDCGDEYRRRFR